MEMKFHCDNKRRLFDFENYESSQIFFVPFERVHFISIIKTKIK